MLNLDDPTILKEKLFINGQWVESDAGDTFPVFNPATGELLRKVANAGKSETRYAVNCAQNAMHVWQKRTAKERSSILRKWHDLILANIQDLATLVTAEQGKPLAEAKAEVAYGASYVEWYAEESKRLYGDIIPSPQSSQRLLVIKQAVGVVAAITPWNFPVAMVTRKVAPALAAGCAIVVKPAAETPLSALALVELAQRAGIPKGVFSMVTGTDAVAIGRVLTDSNEIKKLTFTGSTKIGKLLLSQCASSVKKTSMELGGNAPFVVFDDADIEAAVDGAIASKFRNAGQTCVCANRFLVQREVYQEFSELFAAKTKQLSMGNGMKPNVTMGPLINKQAAKDVHKLVTEAVNDGATILLGHTSGAAEECYYPPTILTNVLPHMRIFRDEIFGPVAPIIAFDSEEEALNLANATDAGLAAYLYSRNISRVWRFSEQLENGIVGVNEGIISSEVAPFGGVKHSGSGREGSKYGLDDYTEIKYICMGSIED